MNRYLSRWGMVALLCLLCNRWLAAEPAAGTSTATFDYIYLYYFDNPIQLIEAITQGKAGIINSTRPGTTQASIAEMIQARAEVDRLQEEIRRYEESVGPLQAKYDRLTEELSVINQELRPAERDEARLRTEVGELTTLLESEPTDEKKKEAVRNRQADLFVAVRHRQEIKARSDETLALQKEAQTAISVTEDRIGLTLEKVAASRTKLIEAANTAVEKDLAFRDDLEKQVRDFAAARDAGEVWNITDGEGTRLVALPDQRSILLVGDRDSVSRYRELIHKLDRPMAQSMVHLWTLQYSSHADDGGNEASHRALHKIDLALRNCREKSEATVNNLHRAYQLTLKNWVEKSKSAYKEVSERRRQQKSWRKPELEDFWHRVSVYDGQCLEIMGVWDNRRQIVDGSWAGHVTWLERQYPLARLYVPDPGKVSNLSELIAVLVMAQSGFQSDFCDKFSELQSGTAVEKKIAPEVSSPFLPVWRLLEMSAGSQDFQPKTSQAAFRLDMARNFRESGDRLLMTALLQRMEHMKELTPKKNRSSSNPSGPKKPDAKTAKIEIPVLQAKARYLQELLTQHTELKDQEPIYLALLQVHTALSTYRQAFPELFGVKDASAGDEQKNKAQEKDARHLYFYSEIEPLRIELRKRLSINALGDRSNGVNRLSAEVLQQRLGRLVSDRGVDREKAVVELKNNKNLTAKAKASLENKRDALSLEIEFYNKLRGNAGLDYRQYYAVGEGLLFDPNTFATAGDELLRNVEQFRRRLTVGGFGNSKEASANMRLRQAMASLEDRIIELAIQPCLVQLRQELQEDSGLEVGTFERQSLLCSNRLLAQTEARASARLEIGQEQDLLESLRLLGQLAATSKSSNLFDALDRIKEERQERHPELYAINTGGVFQLTPIVDPTGQGLRFRFDHLAKSVIQDPNGATRPQLNRIDAQTVNTEVALSNFSLQEIARYRSNSKLGIAERKTGGLPILRDIPGLNEIPLIGWFTRDYGEAAVVQQSVILADTTVYPTLECVLESLTPPYRGVIDFPSDYYKVDHRYLPPPTP